MNWLLLILCLGVLLIPYIAAAYFFGWMGFFCAVVVMWLINVARLSEEG